jgi:hypothetical protein
MKTGKSTQTAVVLAALCIIASSASCLVSHRRRAFATQRSIEDAVQTWEAEGGAVTVLADEEEVLT